MKKRSRVLPCRSFSGTSSMPRCSTSPTWTSCALLMPCSLLFALPLLHFLQRGNMLDDARLKTIPDHAPWPVSLLFRDGKGASRSDDQIDARIKLRSDQVNIDDLAIVHGAHDKWIIG